MRLTIVEGALKNPSRLSPLPKTKRQHARPHHHCQIVLAAVAAAVAAAIPHAVFDKLQIPQAFSPKKHDTNELAMRRRYLYVRRDTL